MTSFIIFKDTNFSGFTQRTFWNPKASQLFEALYLNSLSSNFQTFRSIPLSFSKNLDLHQLFLLSTPSSLSLVIPVILLEGPQSPPTHLCLAQIYRLNPVSQPFRSRYCLIFEGNFSFPFLLEKSKLYFLFSFELMFSLVFLWKTHFPPSLCCF